MLTDLIECFMKHRYASFCNFFALVTFCYVIKFLKQDYEVQKQILKSAIGTRCKFIYCNHVNIFCFTVDIKNKIKSPQRNNALSSVLIENLFG